jgi:type I restriction enzyme S subunit
MAVRDWIPARLGDLAEIKHGYAFDGKYFRDEPSGDVLLTPGNFFIGGGFKDDKRKYYLGPVLEDFLLCEGDLIVTMTDLSKAADTLGYPALVPCTHGVRFLHNQRLGKILIRPNSPVSKDYLYYLLRSQPYRNEILASATGTTVKHTSPNRIAAFTFMLPPRDEQQTIAGMLSTLDAKIELNRRMNETLEAMARAIFTSWFVDFDPVRAKSEGRQPFGVDAETAALFPDSFEPSALGKIPAGWKVGKVRDLVCLNKGTVKPNQHPDELFQHYSLPAYDEKHWPTEEAGREIKSNKFVVPLHSVLVSKLNPRIPRVWMPSVSHVARSIASTEFLITTPKSVTSHEYIYALFTSRTFLETLTTLVTGTSGSHQRVKPESFLAMDTVIPSPRLTKAFSRLVAPLYDKVSGGLSETRSLGALRDALLPKLISGEIRVRKAEHVANGGI